jgi:hypothetical protein
MKRTLLCFCVLLVAWPAFAGGNFFSYTVKPADQSIRITVQNRRYIKILTFVADGSPDCPQPEEGNCNEVSIKAQIGGQPAVTLINGPLPVGRELYVTGPAIVTVTTNATQTLFVTIFQDSN